jgi:hypothetical protein
MGLCKTWTTVNYHFPITLNYFKQIKIFILIQYYYTLLLYYKCKIVLIFFIYVVYIWYAGRGPCFHTPVLPTIPYFGILRPIFGTPRGIQSRLPSGSGVTFRKMATVYSRVCIRFAGMFRGLPNGVHT